eukprot:GHVR01058563.1.p1 GENE.GHVR01058563.1~~GHVR01058563.1.p1  ORF type:complete len:362 (+),score=141.59 GHVR01058563.1:815-1900(+)
MFRRQTHTYTHTHTHTVSVVDKVMEEARGGALTHDESDLMKAELLKAFEKIKWREGKGWGSVKRKMRCFVPFYRLGMPEVLKLWQQYTRQCESVWRDHWRASQYRLERKNREHFLQLLDELEAEGGLTVDPDWSTFVKTHQNNPILINMYGQSGSSGRLLWEERVEALQLDIHTHAKNAEAALLEAGMSSVPNENVDVFITDLKAASDVVISLGGTPLAMPPKHLTTQVHAALTHRAKIREEDQHRRKQRRVRNFHQLLSGTCRHMLREWLEGGDTTPTMTDAENIIKEKDLWVDATHYIPSDEERVEVFVLWMDHMKKKEEERLKEEEERKKRKRQRRHSSSLSTESRRRRRRQSIDADM